MVKEFQSLKMQVVQSLKETYQHKQLLQETTAQFDTEKIELFISLIDSIAVLDKQIALAKRLPCTDDRAVKFLLEIYERHQESLSAILTKAGVTIDSNNEPTTANATVSKPRSSSVRKQYFYQNKSLQYEE